MEKRFYVVKAPHMEAFSFNWRQRRDVRKIADDIIADLSQPTPTLFPYVAGSLIVKYETHPNTANAALLMAERFVKHTHATSLKPNASSTELAQPVFLVDSNTPIYVLDREIASIREDVTMLRRPDLEDQLDNVETMNRGSWIRVEYDV